MTTEISLSEIKKHKGKKSLWVVIHNDVYDVTKFLDEHPGGEETLLEVAGRDGTREFEDVGHSDDARELLNKFKIGTLPPSEKIKTVPQNCRTEMKCPDCLTDSTCPQPENKSWRTYDGSSSSQPKSKSDKKKKSEPKAERRCETIVVPTERRRRPPPPSGGYLKWALLALAAAIIIGVSIKKYSS